MQITNKFYSNYFLRWLFQSFIYDQPDLFLGTNMVLKRTCTFLLSAERFVIIIQKTIVEPQII